ncbi:hypothetical protein DFH09DRAFT_1080547 [Mycena vulgaris]|nr:hypothetical protein DFH09DRAFT_1080547 [Mycena vulgaris]
MVEEAIANGTWVPSAPRVKVDLRKKPRLWDAYLAPPVNVPVGGVGGGGGEGEMDEWEASIISSTPKDPSDTAPASNFIRTHTIGTYFSFHFLLLGFDEFGMSLIYEISTDIPMGGLYVPVMEPPTRHRFYPEMRDVHGSPTKKSDAVDPQALSVVINVVNPGCCLSELLREQHASRYSLDVPERFPEHYIRRTQPHIARRGPYFTLDKLGLEVQKRV